MTRQDYINRAWNFYPVLYQNAYGRLKDCDMAHQVTTDAIRVISKSDQYIESNEFLELWLNHIIQTLVKAIYVKQAQRRGKRIKENIRTSGG